MPVSRHREFTKGLSAIGNRGPRRRRAFWWASDRLSIFLALSAPSSVSHPPFPHLTKSSSLSHNETRIILILPHLVTKPLYLRRRADYNNLFAPSGASLTGLSNETSVLLLVKRNVSFRERLMVGVIDRKNFIHLFALLFVHLVHIRIRIVTFEKRNDFLY